MSNTNITVPAPIPLDFFRQESLVAFFQDGLEPWEPTSESVIDNHASLELIPRPLLSLNALESAEMESMHARITLMDALLGMHSTALSYSDLTDDHEPTTFVDPHHVQLRPDDDITGVLRRRMAALDRQRAQMLTHSQPTITFEQLTTDPSIPFSEVVVGYRQTYMGIEVMVRHCESLIDMDGNSMADAISSDLLMARIIAAGVRPADPNGRSKEGLVGVGVMRGVVTGNHWVDPDASRGDLESEEQECECECDHQHPHARFSSSRHRRPLNSFSTFNSAAAADR